MIVHLPPGAVPGDLLMYSTDARNTTPNELALTSLGDGKWSADATGLVGRFWPTVQYTIEAVPTESDLPYVDLPEDPAIVVSPEQIAKTAGIPLPLTEDQRETITNAILDAQSDVVAYLGREIVPTVFTESGRYDDGTGRWNLCEDNDPLIAVQSATPDMYQGQPTGTYTVTYLAGLNAKDDPTLRPIRRYVAAAAMNSPEFVRMWKTATNTKGEIKSVTTEGQSITYQSATLGGGGKGQPGELPSIKTLDKWRYAGRRVFQRRTAPQPPWPYSGMSDQGTYW